MKLGAPVVGMSRKHKLFLGVFSVALLVLGGCGKSTKEKEPVVPVEVVAAHRGSIAQTVSAEALVFPREQAIITPKISSTIKQFLVQRGSHVKKGQLLAVLENADLSAAAQQSAGEYEQAQAGYAATTGASLPEQIQKAELDAATAKAALDAQKKVYDSRKELFQQGAMPRRDLDSAEVALSQARSAFQQADKQLEDLKRIGKEQALKSAQGQLSAAKGKYLGAQAQLAYSEIRSPIDGVVTDRPLFPGEMATANQPLLTVMDTSRLIAKAHIAQDEAALLSVGNPAQIKLRGGTEEIAGRVTLVSPTLDPGSTTVEVWLEANKPDPSMKPGVTVTVSIVAKTEKDALLVPALAVFKNAEGADYVMIVGSEGKAHVRTVETGIHSANEIQILSGLNEGDSVIRSGGYGLPDGTAIIVQASNPSGSDAGAEDKSQQKNEAPQPGSKEKN